jgi:hypothetical protein
MTDNSEDKDSEDEDMVTDSDADNEVAEKKNKKAVTKEVLTYAQRREANIASLKLRMSELEAEHKITQTLKQKTALPPAKVVLNKKMKDDGPFARRQSQMKQRYCHFP